MAIHSKHRAQHGHVKDFWYKLRLGNERTSTNNHVCVSCHWQSLRYLYAEILTLANISETTNFKTSRWENLEILDWRNRSVILKIFKYNFFKFWHSVKRWENKIREERENKVYENWIYLVSLHIPCLILFFFFNIYFYYFYVSRG